MTRYEAILKKYRARQRAKLERAASDVRSASQTHGIPVKFFGSFAEDCVDRESDLDILVCSDEVPYAFQSELDNISILHKVAIDFVKECNAPHLAMYTVP